MKFYITLFFLGITLALGFHLGWEAKSMVESNLVLKSLVHNVIQGN